MKPIILGCAGPVLEDRERAFFADNKPFGFILFKRNIGTPEEVRKLVADLRASIGSPQAPVLIDQEGGRVARLTDPFWPRLPAMGKIGDLFRKDKQKALQAAKLHAILTASMLCSLGINVNCAPVLDLSFPDTSDVMGDRTLGADVDTIVSLGRVLIETYLAHGVLPVIKHLPGHGRVKVDPHHVLPYVDAAREELERADFAPFMHLRDAPLGMNCHVVFNALDPQQPVSLSRTINHSVIRQTIGFDGFLLSDDLGMNALSLPLEDRAVAALAAGADMALFCSGVWEENRAVTQNLPDNLSTDAQKRWQKACAKLGNAPAPTPDEEEGMRSDLESLLAPIPV